VCLNKLTSARAPSRKAMQAPGCPRAVFTADGALGSAWKTANSEDSVSIRAAHADGGGLPAAERAAFVLREAFAYSHGRHPRTSWTRRRPMRVSLHHRAPGSGSTNRCHDFRPNPGHWRAACRNGFLDAARGGGT